MDIYTTIKSKRKEKGLTLEQVAKGAKTDRFQLSKIESGQVNITVDTLRQIAEGMGCELVIEFKDKK